MLYVVCFPCYQTPEDERRVDTWRQRFCAPHAASVHGHVTLVFGTNRLSRENLAAHVGAVAARTPRFQMTLAASLIWPEDGAYLHFAVPEQGLSRIALLHDQLYTGPLAPDLRTDLPYLPHMTLGCSAVHAKAVTRRADIQEGLPIVANIKALDIVDATDGLSRVATLPLGGGA